MRRSLSFLVLLAGLWLLAAPAAVRAERLTDSFLFRAQNQSVFLSQPEYEQIREAALTLMRRFPPDRYLYLGMGRSPTPLTAFINTLLPGAARDVPGTNIGSLGNDDSVAQAHRRVMQHYDRFLPSRRELGRRKLLLVDYAMTGDSLIQADKLVRGYLQARGRPVQTEVAALCNTRPLPPRQTRLRRLRQRLLREHPVEVDAWMADHFRSPELQQRFAAQNRIEIGHLDTLASRLYTRSYRAVAQYGGFDPRQQTTDQIQRNPEHHRLMAGMKQRVQADRSLGLRLPLRTRLVRLLRRGR